jgi:DHA2 family multidrug resistance protein
MALIPRVLFMMIAVPIVGRIYNHVSPRIVIAFGILLFVVSSFQLSHLTLASGTTDITFPLAVQGVAFACLFVPLTTVALTNIPRHKMTDATGLNSLVRQIGGAIGLALFTSQLGNMAIVAKSGIAAHLNPARPEVWERLRGLEQSFVARGMDPATAHESAVRTLAAIGSQQASVLSFEHMFVVAGALFILVLPALYFLRTSSRKGAGGDVHLEI